MNRFIEVVEKLSGVNRDDTIIIYRKFRIVVTPVPLLCFRRHNFHTCICFIYNFSHAMTAIKTVEQEISLFGTRCKNSAVPFSILCL